MRERGGRTLPFVMITEDQAVPVVRQVVAPGTTLSDVSNLPSNQQTVR